MISTAKYYLGVFSPFGDRIYRTSDWSLELCLQRYRDWQSCLHKPQCEENHHPLGQPLPAPLSAGRVDLSALPAGIYYLTIITETTSYQHKIVKQ